MLLWWCHVSWIFHVSYSLLVIFLHLMDQSHLNFQTGFGEKRPLARWVCQFWLSGGTGHIMALHLCQLWSGAPKIVGVYSDFQPRYKPHLSGFHISVLSLTRPPLLLCSFGSHVLWGVHSSLNWPGTAAGFLLGLDICFYMVSCHCRIGPAGILWRMSKLCSGLPNFVLHPVFMSFPWLRIPFFCLRGTVMPSSGMPLPQWNYRSFQKTIL